MLLKRNIKVGKIKFIFYLINFVLAISFCNADELEGNFTNIKILDKISSKNILIKLTNQENYIYKDLSIKSMKCQNSKFDDNPETTAYIQVKDLTDNDNDNVFVFNGWMFSSSPSINPFDHPVYDIWLVSCYQIIFSLSSQLTLKLDDKNFS